MADRCIRLTRIHAIQWFGYCDTFDIHGNLLIAGRTGAGKSVLMDLLQLVLIGDQRARYNAASDGRGHTAGRDKKSYCLCDTQEDVDGVAQYARDGGITYIALEFTWPDGERVETWGMRIEYASVEAQTPEEEFFVIPERLERSDFVSADGYALEIEGFRLLVKKKEGETFRTITEYRKTLANHLNFHRETVDFLMPSAMSFSFLPRFDDFCRRYILQSENIKIDPVQQSYRSYLRIREELEKLQDKVNRLTSAVTTHQEYMDTLRDSIACQYLAAEFGREAALGAVRDLTEKIAEITRQQEQLQAEFDELVSAIAEKDQSLDSLKNIFRDSGGSLLLELKGQIREAVEKVKQLQERGKTLTEEKERRVKRTAEFLRQAEGFIKERNGLTAGELTHSLKRFEEARPAELKAALQQLCGAVQATATKVRNSVAKESEEHQRLQTDLIQLQDKLKALEFNRVEDSPLLDELNRSLPQLSRENPARQLRELCEVIDEDWRPAIELVFSRKFAIVVSPEHYPDALRIYQEFKRDSLRESLVDPIRALERSNPVHPQSLATKLECREPVARSVVDNLFGQVICVQTLDELRQYPDAILPDGFRLHGLFAERPRRYDGHPCIGAKGIARLKAHLIAQADEYVAAMRGIEPLLTKSAEIQQLIATHRLNSEDMEADIRVGQELKDAEVRRDSLIARNTAAVTPELETQLKVIHSLEEELKQVRDRQIELAGKIQTPRLADLQRQLTDARQDVNRAEAYYQNISIETGSALNIVRCEEFRSYYRETFPTDESRARAVKEKFAILKEHIPDKLKQLELIRQGLVDQHADLKAEPDFDPKTDWNASYKKLLDRIKVDDMPARQAQALEEEQRWQNLFRTTVASRLSHAIGDVRTTIAKINQPLKKPIGDSQYHIHVEDNPSKEFQEYRRVLEACSLTNDGESIFASLAADAREGVERVFKALVDEPEGKLAQAFLDYRSYFRYDMLVSDPKRPELPPKSLNRHSDKFSGGEKQTPFYISILACYLRAYHRHLALRYSAPSIGLVPIDEAFSKMSGERITDAIRALRDVELQGILSMSSGNWPYAIGECDQVLAIHQREEFADGRKSIRNIGALLSRQEALERSKEWE